MVERGLREVITSENNWQTNLHKEEEKTHKAISIAKQKANLIYEQKILETRANIESNLSKQKATVDSEVEKILLIAKQKASKIDSLRQDSEILAEKFCKEILTDIL